ncbi:MAG: TPM domain-containing protein, partial [Acidobacteriota bacterium]|nr:TPM domain-containing protein [Acidobacteriota bacterium]
MKSFLKIAAGLALAVTAWGLDTKTLKPTGYVNDFSNTLDAANKQTLEDYCANLERVTGVQMAMVLVNTLDGEPVEDVANRLYREWGIGKKGKDEGILILLAVKDRKSRAELGYGIEPLISDGAAGGILRQIRPILQQGNYGGALLAAAQQMGAIIAQAKGVELGGPEPLRVTGRQVRQPSIPFPLILLGLFFLLWLLGRGGRGGSGTGFLTGMILGNMMGGRGGG